MRELEPVGKHRVFVPEPGDLVLVCEGCGHQRYLDASLDKIGLEEELEVMTSEAHCANERATLVRIPKNVDTETVI